MAAVLGLLVHCWVPVSVIEDDITGSSQVESYTSWASATDKTQHFGIVIKAFYYSLSHLGPGVAIQSDVVKLEHVQHFFKDVKHFGHLSKDQHFLPSLFDVA